MKKSSVILLTATATVTMVALIACGSKNGGVDVNSKNIAKPSGGGVDQKAVKDQSGAIGLNGFGALNGAGSSGDPFGTANFNQNLIVDQSAVVTSPNVSDTDKKAIEEAAAKKTYINMGCKNIDAGWTKDLEEDKTAAAKDVALYSAKRIFICGEKKFNAATTITASEIIMSSATLTAMPKAVKLIIRTESIHLYNTVTKIYAPIKSDTETGMDLIISKEITGAYDANGQQAMNENGQPNTRMADAKLQLLTAAQLPAATTPKNPGRGKGRNGVAPVGTGSADADLTKNTKINTPNTIEEENGNTESF